AFERDEPDGSASVAAVVLLRPRDANRRVATVGQGHDRQLRRGAEGRGRARAGQWTGRAGAVEKGGMMFIRHSGEGRTNSSGTNLNSRRLARRAKSMDGLCNPVLGRR